MRFAPTLQLEQSLSLAAFVMSLGITLINLYYAMRGSEIAVDQPRQIILYRDGEGSSSVLAAAIRVDAINVADGYGDVLKDATLSFGADRASLDYQGTIKTVFVGESKAASPPCELGLRCLTLPGLIVVERSDEILDIPSGAARTYQLSFPAARWNCRGAEGKCIEFGNFSETASLLDGGDLAVTVKLYFHSDGVRTLDCHSARFDAAYLKKVGWVSIPCQSSTRS
ncbi:MAG: hypothetical protein V4696_08850 [Pseudomonadota bacterium]